MQAVSHSSDLDLGLIRPFADLPPLILHPLSSLDSKMPATLSTSHASFAPPLSPKRSTSSPPDLPPSSSPATALGPSPTAEPSPITHPTPIRAFLSRHWSRYVLIITDPHSLLSRIFVFANLFVWLYLNWVTLREAREGRSGWGWVVGTMLALGLTGFNWWETWKGIRMADRARERGRRGARRRDTEYRVGTVEQEKDAAMLVGEKSD